MRNLPASLLLAQKDSLFEERLKITLSDPAGVEADVVLEQDRILQVPTEIETTDSQTTEVICYNADGYFTLLDLKGWDAVFEWGLLTLNGVEYTTLPPFKVLDQRMSSSPGRLLCFLSLIGIPNRLAEDKASKDYLHHWSDLKTVKDLITEVASGVAVSSELTEQQTSSDSWEALNATIWGSGQVIPVVALPSASTTITKWSFWLKKVGTPAAGNVTFIIRATDDDEILGQKVLGDVSVVTSGTGAYYEVTFDTPVVVAEEVFVYVAYVAGDAGNHIAVGYNSTAVKAGEYYRTVPKTGDRVSYTSYDCRYKYKYTVAGVDCFDHCEAYTVIYDSEDTLMDTYLPKDALKIYEGDDRLSVINKLLRYTTCVKRVEDDGAIHVIVPTTTGEVHDYEFSLADGEHTFFSKANRDALVIPNKITVHSYTEDDDQYTGYYTDTTSYALLPISAFVKAKLTSDAQGTSIATAMITQLQLTAQRGSANVPNNLGAEVYDYVKVTDARQEDYREGNIGYIRRSYTNGRVTNMGFSFGRMSFKGVPGTRPSLLSESRLKTELELEDEAVVRGAQIKEFSDIVFDGFEDVFEILNEHDELIAIIEAILGYTEDGTTTSDQIKTALLPYYTKTQADVAIAAVISDTVYGAGWDTVTTIAPSKNAVYDKVELVSGLLDDVASSGDLSGSRALDTPYQNTSSKIMTITVTLTLESGDGAYFLVENDSTPNVVNAAVGGGDSTAYYATMTVKVPPGWYYQVYASAGTPVIYKWFEWLDH